MHKCNRESTSESGKACKENHKACEGVRTAKDMLREAERNLLAAARVIYSTGLDKELMQLVGA